MEIANTDKKATAVLNQQSLSQNPVLKQLGVMIGIAASVALGVAVVLWSQTPNYSLIYGNLAQKDASEVVAALEQAGIDFKVDESSGAVMVATGKLQEARMKLAGMGLPRSDSLGFELLQQETGFGTSRAMEAARFHRALEGELARTISALANIETARVHLATPKQSVFLRNREKPSASVVVKLYSGRALEKPQVDAIVHLVASSVPELETGRVTVVDHKGNMLSMQREDREMMLSATQFEYTKKQEEHYRRRVENILAPIIGLDRIRAQVTAEVDFTVTEQTAERFNPDFPALRSEQVDEQANRLSQVQGVPGALSNQPPATGVAPEEAASQAGSESSADGALNTSKRATRNFELDRTVSHTRLSSGSVRRLSAAVVVDDIITVGSDGTRIRRERTPEELNRITQLVREAIGFNATRGDSVRVINAPFMEPEEMEPLPDPALWEQPWVWNLLKQAGGILLVIVLIFFVLKPTLHRLTAATVVSSSGSTGNGEDYDAERGAPGNPQLMGGDNNFKLPGPEEYEHTLDAARKMVNDDPKRVAQVIKSWVAEDAG